MLRVPNIFPPFSFSLSLFPPTLSPGIVPAWLELDTICYNVTEWNPQILSFNSALCVSVCPWDESAELLPMFFQIYRMAAVNIERCIYTVPSLANVKGVGHVCIPRVCSLGSFVEFKGHLFSLTSFSLFVISSPFPFFMFFHSLTLSFLNMWLKYNLKQLSEETMLFAYSLHHVHIF